MSAPYSGTAVQGHNQDILQQDNLLGGVGLALTEEKLKEKVAGLELVTKLVFYGNAELHTHITNIILFVNQETR
jgi:hypothetical protein